MFSINALVREDFDAVKESVRFNLNIFSCACEASDTNPATDGVLPANYTSLDKGVGFHYSTSENS
jgi:hypothetical protein